MGSVSRSLHQNEVFGPLCLSGFCQGWCPYLHCPCPPFPGCHCPSQSLPGCNCPCKSLPGCHCSCLPLFCCHCSCSCRAVPCCCPSCCLHCPPAVCLFCFLHSGRSCFWWSSCPHPWSCPVLDLPPCLRGLNSHLMLINICFPI